MKNIFFGLIVLLLIGIISATTSLEVPAVDAQGNGLLSTITATATSGTGDVFVSIVPLTGIDTQNSEQTAVEVAAKFASVDMKKYNMMFKIESSAEVVDGPSAGAALTLLSYSEFTGKKMRKDIALTGTIDKEGNVGKIGGVFEKAQAVAESKLRDYKVFIIPRGQRIQNGVDVVKYAAQKWNLQVVEVDTIQDVINYAFNTQEGTQLVVKNTPAPELNLIPFSASDESSLFRDIAQTEISETKSRIKTADVTTDIKAQVDEIISLTQKLIDNKYYYSAANTAFLATITLDEIAMANGSKRDFQNKLKELRAIQTDLKFANQTEGNFEWVIGAKLRYHWAADKLDSAQDEIAVGSLGAASGDLAVASSWLRAASKMNEIAKTKQTGLELNDYYFRDLASKTIDDAKTLEKGGLLDQEATDHYNTAVKTFEDADYLAAVYDASFAIAYSAALDQVTDKSFSEIATDLCKTPSFDPTCQVFKQKQFKSLWAELYYAHGLYNFQDANLSRDTASAVNGVKLTSLAEAFEKLRPQVLDIAANPPQNVDTVGAGGITIGTPRPTNELKVEVVAMPQDSTKDLIIYSIIGLVALLVIYAAVSSRKGGEENAIGSVGKVERAEDLFLRGKISERSFDYFKQKYEKEGKNKNTAKAGKQAKTKGRNS